MEAVINKCPRFPPSEEVLLPQLHSWTSSTDLKTSQEPVKGYSGLVQAGSSNQTGHNLWEDAAKPDKWSGAAAFSMVSVGSAITSEDRLVNVSTNTFPSCLTPVSWGAVLLETSNYHSYEGEWSQRRKRLCLLTRGILHSAESLSWGEVGIGWVFRGTRVRPSGLSWLFLDSFRTSNLFSSSVKWHTQTSL